MNNKSMEMIKTGQSSCVIVKNGDIIQAVKGKGIRPLLELYIKNKEDLNGSFLADKVIGKAASILIIKSGVKSCYGQLVSKKALELLEKYNVEINSGEVTEYIQNMDKSGMCPLENLVFNCENLDEGVSIITNFVESKSKGKIS